MSTATTSQSVESNVKSGIDHSNPALVAAKAEAQAFIKNVQGLADFGNGLGAEAMLEVARSLGGSANKYGRPHIVQFAAYVLALSGRNLSVNAHIQLAQSANKMVRSGCKPAFRIVGKTGEMDGSASYKLALPAQFEASVN